MVQNGLEALASLSMDKITIYDESGNSKSLSVSLKTIDWAEKHKEKMLLLFKESQNIKFDNVPRIFDEFLEGL